MRRISSLGLLWILRTIWPEERQAARAEGCGHVRRGGNTNIASRSVLGLPGGMKTEQVFSLLRCSKTIGLGRYAFTFTPALANSTSASVKLNATVCRSQHSHCSPVMKLEFGFTSLVNQRQTLVSLHENGLRKLEGSEKPIRELSQQSLRLHSVLDVRKQCIRFALV
jgi:hypothetical protein